MKKPNVLIVNGYVNDQYDVMFRSEGWEVSHIRSNLPEFVTPLDYDAAHLLKQDVVLFTGGADVNPGFYGEKPLMRTFCDFERDAYEAELYGILLAMSIPMIGICRGGQFLNVMNGGRMLQHIVGHATGCDHLITDIDTSRSIMVSSTHHQMMVPNQQEGVIRAYADIRNEDSCGLPDVEVVSYPRTKCLCFQPHPEFFKKGHECPEYFFELLGGLLDEG